MISYRHTQIGHLMLSVTLAVLALAIQQAARLGA